MTLSVKTITALEGLFKQAGRMEKSIATDAKVSEQVSLIFQKISDSTNPLVMDSKAYLAKIKIEAPSLSKIEFPDITKKLSGKPDIKPKSEYEEFEGRVLKETGSIIREKINGVYSRINPIASDNIGTIKTELSSLIKTPKLRQKIFNCANPDELYKLLKANMDEIIVSDDYINFMKKVDPAAITPELEIAYSKICSQEIERAKRIIGLFTPKSTRPEVLKLEEEVRALGIKDINFSDDLEQAKLIKEAVEDLINRKIPLNSSITVTPMMPMTKSGLGVNTKDGGHIFLPTSKEQFFTKEMNLRIDALAKDTTEFKNAKIENQEKFLSEMAIKKNTFISTQNPKHMVFHETAHTFQPTSLKAHVTELTEDEFKIASEISIYAKSSPNGEETMPEMFAKLMDGQVLTDKQMELYLKLGGIVPKV